MKKNISLLSAPAAVLALVSGHAEASGVDYGALEELFGEPITTSATGAPQRATEAPVNMSIITQEQIKRSGAVDLPGVLERLASLDVERHFRGQAEVSVRGYNSGSAARLLVLVNGRQVYLDHFGMTNWDLIPVQMDEIRQIEVVRGPNTALFGFNAVAGVVNIITYDVMRDDIDTVRGTVGTDEWVSGSGVLSHKFGDLGLRLSVGGLNAGAWDTEPTLAGTGIDPIAHSAALNAGYAISDKTTATYEATWANNERRQVTSTASIYPTLWTATSHKVALNSETPLGIADVQFYQNVLQADYVAIIDVEQTVSVLSGGLVMKPAAAHTLRLAGEFRNNDLVQSTPILPAGQTTFSVGYKVFALSGMWNWQATDALALTSAVRVDRLELDASNIGPPFTTAAYDGNFTEPSVNIGAVYRLTDTDSLRLSGARGVQSPSLLEYGYRLEVPFVAKISGSPFVGPTIVYNAEAGWDHGMAAIGGTLRASLFWQENQDIKALNSGVLGTGQVPNNFGTSQVYGAEVALEGKSGPIRWDAQYSYRQFDDDLTPQNAAVAVSFERSSPQHVVTGGVSYESGPFEIGADVRGVSDTEQFRSGIKVVDSYLLLNAHATWTVDDRFAVSLIGRGIADEETHTTPYAGNDREFYVSLGKKF